MQDQAIRKNRQFIGLLGQNSSFLSAFSLAQVCLTWYVFTNTHSAADVGYVAITETIAVLIVSLPIGTLVDRMNKGLLLVLAGFTGFLVFLILSAYSVFLPFGLAVVMLLSALWGVSRELGRSSSLSILPDLITEGGLANANGIYRGLGSTLGAVSNALGGGIIVTLGIVSGFLFSAGAYFLSAVFALTTLFPFMKLKQKREIQREKGKMLRDLGEGLSWLVSRKGFFLLTVSATFFNFFLVIVETYLVIYVALGLHGTPLVFGLILASMAAGDVIGSLFAGKVNLVRHSGKINVVLYGGVPGACILLMGLFPVTVLAIILMFVAQFCLGVSINAWLTTAHNVVPQQMLGRYFALDGVLSSISPISIAVGALIISVMGIDGNYILSGVLLLIFTAVFAGMKSLWNLDGRPEEVLQEEIQI